MTSICYVQSPAELWECVKHAQPAVFRSQEFTRTFLRIISDQLGWIKLNSTLSSSSPVESDKISLDLHLLASQYGHSPVNLTDCQTGECQPSNLSDYIHQCLSKTITTTINSPLLYCKDWHFFTDYPAMHQLLINQLIPECLRCAQNDWLNVYWNGATLPTDGIDLGGDDRCAARQDYRFIYLGPDRSWTPLHADVFRSNSWSLNVCGEKEWILFPPSVTEYLRSAKTGRYIHDIRCPKDVSVIEYPDYHGKALPRAIKFVQNPAELVFIPSNWFHQVHNRGLTMSINHNWCNAYNIMDMVDHYHQCLGECRDEISHLLQPPFSMSDEEWQAEVQKLMTHHFGMNRVIFLDFLHTIQPTLEDDYCLSKCRQAIREILKP